MTWLHFNKEGLTNIQPSLMLVQSRSQTTAIITNIFDNFKRFPYYSVFRVYYKTYKQSSGHASGMYYKIQAPSTALIRDRGIA